jgi:hypothetical protein
MATAAQRLHVQHVIESVRPHRSQLDYPPNDNRDSRDSTFWRLTESQALALLEHGGRLQFDCSEWCPWVLRCAGLWPWSQPGYTGSHLELLTQHYSDPKQALPGALVIFGPGAGDHESIVYEADPAGGNPLLSSHGRSGLDIIRLRDEARWHRPPVRFLSIAHL